MLGRRQDHRGDDRLLELGDPTGIGEFRGAVDFLHYPVRRRHPIQHAWRRRHQVHVVLALQALLDDLHVQEPEETTAEPESERGGGFRLVEERGVVQSQLLQRVPQLGVLVAFDRVETGEDHRLQLLEAGKRFGRRPGGLSDGVANLGVSDALDVGDDEADLPDAELIDRDRLRAKTHRGCPPRSPERSPSVGSSACS